MLDDVFFDDVFFGADVFDDDVFDDGELDADFLVAAIRANLAFGVRRTTRGAHRYR